MEIVNLVAKSERDIYLYKKRERKIDIYVDREIGRAR